MSFYKFTAKATNDAGIFYMANGYVYAYEVTDEDEQVRFYRESLEDGEYTCQIVHKNRFIRMIRNMDHGLKEREDITPAEMDVIADAYPWIRHYDIEAACVLKKALKALLFHAIKHRQKELSEAIIRMSGLDEKKLENREIKAVREIVPLEVSDHELKCTVRPKAGRSKDGVYKAGENCLWAGMGRVYLSNEVTTELKEVHEKILALRNAAFAGKDGFAAVQNGKSFFAFRKTENEKQCYYNRYSYEIFCQVDSVYAEYLKSAELESFLSSRMNDPEAVRETAKKANDLYAAYLCDYLCKNASEDQLEYLFQKDGRNRAVPGNTHRTPGEMTVISAKKGARSFFNRRPNYYLDLVVDGKRFDRLHWITKMKSVTFIEYHHFVTLEFTDKQLEELRRVCKEKGDQL